jgi:hypothetical protein
MAPEYRDKQTLITTVQGQYLSFATFPTPLLSHYPLPLNSLLMAQTFCTFQKKNFNIVKFTATKKVGHKTFFLPFLFFVIVGSGMEENQDPG